MAPWPVEPPTHQLLGAPWLGLKLGVWFSLVWCLREPLQLGQSHPQLRAGASLGPWLHVAPAVPGWGVLSLCQVLQQHWVQVDGAEVGWGQGWWFLGTREGRCHLNADAMWVPSTPAAAAVAAAPRQLPPAPTGWCSCPWPPTGSMSPRLGPSPAGDQTALSWGLHSAEMIPPQPKICPNSPPRQTPALAKTTAAPAAPRTRLY